MKGLFPQYSHLDSVDYSEAWKNALFVFDTNVLLNLYRYHENTRIELIDILKNLADRVWIPHHVALEFHRNRISVIAAQGNSFKEIKSLLNTTKNKLKEEIYKLGLHNRHSLINAEKLITDIETLTNNFAAELETLEDSQQKINDPDPIKKIIEELFSKKVGPAFKDQKEIDELNKEAEKRYKLKIPPGYKDDEKDKNKPDEFFHNSLIYKRKYGDYIAWNQILNKAQNLKSKKLIFITDDGKEDWWLKVSAEDASNNLGPRVELIDEAINIGKLDTFLMYKPEGFLKYAKEFLAAKVSDETLSEARYVSTTNTQPSSNKENVNFTPLHVEHAVKSWLQEHFAKVDGLRASFPDFIVEHEEDKIGIEVFLFKPDRLDRELRLFNNLKSVSSHQSELFDELNVIWVVSNEEDVSFLVEYLRNTEFNNGSHKICLQIGLFEIVGSIPKITRTWSVSS